MTQETGTLAVLNAQPGDVVECVSTPTHGGEWTVGKQYTMTDKGLPADRCGPQKSSISEFRIISRAKPPPPPPHIVTLPCGKTFDLTNPYATPYGLLDEVYGAELRAMIEVQP